MSESRGGSFREMRGVTVLVAALLVLVTLGGAWVLLDVVREVRQLRERMEALEARVAPLESRVAVLSLLEDVRTQTPTRPSPWSMIQ